MKNSNANETLTIGEVATQAGVRTSAVRYYESQGLLPAPQRINGRRVYDANILQRLSLLQLAQKAGFTIHEIHELLHGFDQETRPSERWQQMAYKKLTEIDQMLARAQQMKEILLTGMRCECLRLEDCVVLINKGCQQNK